MAISIHALPAEGDRRRCAAAFIAQPFQSTPSPRRATVDCLGFLVYLCLFQSTPSPRRATISSGAILLSNGISIHALPAEGDVYWLTVAGSTSYFNPRPPRGGRRVHLSQLSKNITISIHALPAEGDLLVGPGQLSLGISIHALPAEGDGTVPGSDCLCREFQSTPSPRRATAIQLLQCFYDFGFQSTPSPRRATNMPPPFI